MASKLRQADSHFIFTPAAQCRLEFVRLESPLLPSELLMPRSGSGSDMPKDGKHDKDFATQYMSVDKSSSVDVRLLRRGGFAASLIPLP